MEKGLQRFYCNGPRSTFLQYIVKQKLTLKRDSNLTVSCERLRVLRNNATVDPSILDSRCLPAVQQHQGLPLRFTGKGKFIDTILLMIT